MVHRDLKPANVVVTRSGAKLLDFGIAKLGSSSPVPSDAADAPAGTETATRPGLLLGTLPYMPPEQLHGHEADARTDIFALGALVYEMLTGRRAFEGRSEAHVLAAILERDPPALGEIAPTSPPHLERVLRRCLAKDPDDRWQSAADVAAELRWIAESASVWADAPDASPRRGAWRQLLPWGLALVAAVTGGVALFRSDGRQTSPVTRASISLPAGHRLAIAPHRGTLAISPSGSHLAYIAAPESGPREIYVRRLDSLESTRLPGTEGANDLFFSPDGRWVGFFVADRELKKAPLNGGATVTLCEAPGAEGASWAPDDTICFAARGQGLRRVSANAGEPTVVTTPDRENGESAHVFPDVLPGGRAILYALGSKAAITSDERSIVAHSLETGEQKILVEGGNAPRYLPTGHVLYSRAGALWAVRFELENLSVSGPSVRVLDGVRTHQASGDPAYTVARNGTLVYVRGAPEADSALAWLDRRGVASPVTAERRAFNEPAFSPDGRRLAVTIGWAKHQVWIYDVSRGTSSRLTHEWDQHHLIWTPDGTRILFSSSQSEPANVFSIPVDGGGAPQQLLSEPGLQWPESISPDGRILAYVRRTAATASDILVYPMDESTPPREFLATEFSERQARFSPDGSWLAYVSDRTGRYEVYVHRLSRPGRDPAALQRGWRPAPLGTGRARDLLSPRQPDDGRGR